MSVGRLSAYIAFFDPEKDPEKMAEALEYINEGAVDEVSSIQGHQALTKDKLATMNLLLPELWKAIDRKIYDDIVRYTVSDIHPKVPWWMLLENSTRQVKTRKKKAVDTSPDVYKGIMKAIMVRVDMNSTLKFPDGTEDLPFKRLPIGLRSGTPDIR